MTRLFALKWAAESDPTMTWPELAKRVGFPSGDAARQYAYRAGKKQRGNRRKSTVTESK